MNEAYGGPEDLPFDLSHRVIRYNMPEGAADKKTERLSLQNKLQGAIKGSLDSLGPKSPPAPSKADSFLTVLLNDPRSDLYVIDPTTSARSAHYYQFAYAPHDDSLSRPLDRAVEAQFRDSVVQAFGNPGPNRLPRKMRTTTFERNPSAIKSQRFSLTENGALGFVALACVHANDDSVIPPGDMLLFFPIEFVRDLACFLACVSMFHRAARHRGSGRLITELHVPRSATVFGGISDGMRVSGKDFFDEPVDTLQTSDGVSDDFNELTGAEIRRILPMIMHHIARSVGRVLSSTFGADVEPLVAGVLKRVGLA
jgi:hypothetical protein